MKLVGERRFDGLAPIAESLLGHKFIDSFQELSIKCQRDFRFGHGGMMNYHTIAIGDLTLLQPVAVDLTILTLIVSWIAGLRA